MVSNHSLLLNISLIIAEISSRKIPDEIYSMSDQVLDTSMVTAQNRVRIIMNL